MPAQAQTYNDGGVPHGSRKIKVYAQGAADASGESNWSAGALIGTYVAEGFPLTRPTYTQDRYDESRIPNGGFGQVDVSRFSLTTQLATKATPHLMPGWAFTTPTVDPTTGAPQPGLGNAVTESFVIESVDDIENFGDITKQTIRVKKLYGTAVNRPPVFDWITAP